MTYRLPSKELEHLFALYLRANTVYNQFVTYYEFIANNPAIVDEQTANSAKEALFRSEMLRYKVWHRLLRQQTEESTRYASIV